MNVGTVVPTTRRRIYGILFDSCKKWSRVHAATAHCSMGSHLVSTGFARGPLI
jgi:hypothetical protein